MLAIAGFWIAIAPAGFVPVPNHTNAAIPMHYLPGGAVFGSGVLMTARRQLLGTWWTAIPLAASVWVVVSHVYLLDRLMQGRTSAGTTVWMMTPAVLAAAISAATFLRVEEK